MVVVGGLAAAAALLVLVVALVGGDDRAGEGGRADASSAASTVAAVGLEGECASVHAGHATMMWNAVMADEMVDAGCPWPYPPFDVPHAAPAPARSLDAPFEAHRYDEIWRMIGTRGHGVCEIRPVPDPPGEGFTFGFVYLVAEPGCAARVEPVEIEVREYAAPAPRDAAALARPGALVLGRWVVALDGGGDRVDDLRTGFGDLGAIAP